MFWFNTCEEVLGKMKTQHKESISSDTIKRIEKRKEKKAILNINQKRTAKVKAQEEYTAADRDVKASIKTILRNWPVKPKMLKGQWNLKDLYLTTTKLASKFQQT
jgi:hypothetical protein